MTKNQPEVADGSARRQSSVPRHLTSTCLAATGSCSSRGLNATICEQVPSFWCLHGTSPEQKFVTAWLAGWNTPFLMPETHGVSLTQAHWSGWMLAMPTRTMVLE